MAKNTRDDIDLGSRNLLSNDSNKQSRVALLHLPLGHRAFVGFMEMQQSREFVSTLRIGYNARGSVISNGKYLTVGKPSRYQTQKGHPSCHICV
ncbi:uncharacterized protein RAG0_00709 [Rhynchosporium agropyri]|uniref:Uncharacterized protein n=1 Tax=Rhynchosporium agropyri TaxID=914238 RepID=A0A1E1JTZ8_9HELO|nr:uncharacterized protein RAG0_00709 [Rhynchosporium agropyri]